MDDDDPPFLRRLYDAETERPQDVGPPVERAPSLSLIGLVRGLARLFRRE